MDIRSRPKRLPIAQTRHRQHLVHRHRELLQDQQAPGRDWAGFDIPLMFVGICEPKARAPLLSRDIKGTVSCRKVK